MEEDVKKMVGKSRPASQVVAEGKGHHHQGTMRIVREGGERIEKGGQGGVVFYLDFVVKMKRTQKNIPVQ